MGAPVPFCTKIPRWTGQWDDFDPDPRVSYYLFLRQVYQMTASEAWATVNQWIPKLVEWSGRESTKAAKGQGGV